MEREPLYTAEKASIILGIPYKTIVNYIWLYRFIKPVALRPWRFDFDQLVALRRIRDMLRCGIPHKDITDLLMLPHVSVGVDSSSVINTLQSSQECVTKRLKRYRRMID